MAAEVSDVIWQAIVRSHGIEPPWTGVYRGGVDITDTVPPEEWPYPWNRSKGPVEC